MPKRKLPPLTIIIDSREQLPYSFNDYNCNIIRTSLKTGDYSIDGYDSEVAIERKSKADLYQSFGRGRQRFEKEFHRLSGFSYAALVIEAGMQDILTPPPKTKMSPASVLQSVISWGIRYGVQVYFADNRNLAERLVFSILEKFFKLKVSKK
jgi:ERCC4-type nuclease